MSGMALYVCGMVHGLITVYGIIKYCMIKLHKCSYGITQMVECSAKLEFFIQCKFEMLNYWDSFRELFSKDF